jgi:hypothetical protein
VFPRWLGTGAVIPSMLGAYLGRLSWAPILGAYLGRLSWAPILGAYLGRLCWAPRFLLDPVRRLKPDG